MQDTASHSSSQLDNGELRHTLSVHDVGAALVTAGVPRSRRQVVRYCETGMLDAVKVPGPTGAQWYVAPASLPKAIGDLKQWEAQRAGQSSPEQDMSSTVVAEKPLNTTSDTARHGAPDPATSHLPIQDKNTATESVMPDGMSRYVARLEHDLERMETEIDTKNEQIKGLLERDRETNYLVRGLQQMLAPLLGQPVQRREVDPSVDNSTPRNDGMGL